MRRTRRLRDRAGASGQAARPLPSVAAPVPQFTPLGTQFTPLGTHRESVRPVLGKSPGRAPDGSAWTWGFCPCRGDTALGRRGWRWAADTGRKGEGVGAERGRRRASAAGPPGVGPGVLPPRTSLWTWQSLAPSAVPSGGEPQDSGEPVGLLVAILALNRAVNTR